MIQVGCDLALKKSCIYIKNTDNGIINVLLLTSRKKLIKLKKYNSDDGNFNVEFVDCEITPNERIDTISHFIISHNPIRISVENYAFSRASMRLYQIGELIGTIKYLISKSSIEINLVGIKVLKKNATGNGNADKLDMFKSIPEKLVKGYIKTLADKYNIKYGKDGISDIVDAYFLSRE